MAVGSKINDTNEVGVRMFERKKMKMDEKKKINGIAKVQWLKRKYAILFCCHFMLKLRIELNACFIPHGAQ